MKYRKKPVVIEAKQWFKHGDHPAVHPFPLGWSGAKAEGYPDYHPDNLGIIETLEGHHQVSPGDWIITGVKGEHYPCKPDIFEMTYEKEKNET